MANPHLRYLYAKVKSLYFFSWRHSRHAIRFILIALISSFSVLTPLRAEEATGHWVGTWAAAPENCTKHCSNSVRFAERTLRQIVRTSVGGSVARLKISNLFGTHSLVIAGARIALPNEHRPGAIKSITSRQITFAKQNAVIVPAGATILSDAIAFPVPELGNVAIDLYLQSETGDATFHNTALQTNFIAEGNAAGEENLPGAQAVKSVFFITNLDVQGPPARGAVVALGASITDGSASTSDANMRWTDKLASRLAAANLGIGVLNEGIGGNRLLTDGPAPSALSRFGRDVASQSGVQWVILSDNPINDLGSAPPQDLTASISIADILIASIGELIKISHRNRIKVICSTLTPYRGAAYWTHLGELARERFNTFIHTSGNGCDGVLDQDAATHDPADPTKFLVDYDSGDHLHPNDAGHRAIANAMDLTLFSHVSNSK